MTIMKEAIEAGCAAITERRGFKWPSDFSEEELSVGRENMELAITAAFAAMPRPSVFASRHNNQTGECEPVEASTQMLKKLEHVHDLASENERLREALEQIANVAGNIPDDILCSATGANDARYRGGLVCTARDIAKEALERT